MYRPVSMNIENYQKLPHTTANWNDTENCLQHIFQLLMCHVFLTSGLAINNNYQKVTMGH